MSLKIKLPPPPRVNNVEEKILSEGVFTHEDDEAIRIRDYSVFLSESMIIECFENEDLIKQTCMLEGAKFDWAMKNFLKEGKDYKGLKKELKDIIKANDLDDRDLKSKGKGFMHVCKRILQINQDLGMVSGAASLGYAIGTLNPIIIAGGILGFVIGFIINRILRFAWDTVEFNTIKDDAEDIVRDLRRTASKTEDEKLKKKYNDEADRLEKAIEKYSSKNNDKKEEKKND